MFSCCDSSSCCSGGKDVTEYLLPVEEMMLLFYPSGTINGIVGCFVVTGGIGSIGFIRVFRHSRKAVDAICVAKLWQ